LKGLGLREIWEGLGLVLDLKLEVSDVKVSFYKLKFSVYHTAKTLVKVNFSYYTELTNITNFYVFKKSKISFSTSLVTTTSF